MRLFLESLDRESVNFAANPIDVSLVTRLLVVVVDQLFAKPLQCRGTVITIKLSKFPSLIKMNATSCNTTVEAILLFTVRTTYCVFVPLWPRYFSRGWHACDIGVVLEPEHYTGVCFHSKLTKLSTKWIVMSKHIVHQSRYMMKRQSHIVLPLITITFSAATYITGARQASISLILYTEINRPAWNCLLHIHVWPIITFEWGNQHALASRHTSCLSVQTLMRDFDMKFSALLVLYVHGFTSCNMALPIDIVTYCCISFIFFFAF